MESKRNIFQLSCKSARQAVGQKLIYPTDTFPYWLTDTAFLWCFWVLHVSQFYGCLDTQIVWSGLVWSAYLFAQAKLSSSLIVLMVWEWTPSSFGFVIFDYKLSMKWRKNTAQFVGGWLDFIAFDMPSQLICVAKKIKNIRPTFGLINSI